MLWYKQKESYFMDACFLLCIHWRSSAVCSYAAENRVLTKRSSRKLNSTFLHQVMTPLFCAILAPLSWSPNINTAIEINGWGKKTKNLQQKVSVDWRVLNVSTQTFWAIVDTLVLIFFPVVLSSYTLYLEIIKTVWVFVAIWMSTHVDAQRSRQTCCPRPRKKEVKKKKNRAQAEQSTSQGSGWKSWSRGARDVIADGESQTVL